MEGEFQLLSKAKNWMNCINLQRFVHLHSGTGLFGKESLTEMDKETRSCHYSRMTQVLCGGGGGVGVLLLDSPIISP